ncbi:MAG: hypothetical protein WBA45_11165 [Microthrixaceae bacterium]
MPQPEDVPIGLPVRWKATACFVVLAMIAFTIANVAIFSDDDSSDDDGDEQALDEPVGGRERDVEDPDIQRLVKAAARLDADASTAAGYQEEMADRTGPTLLFVQDALSGTFLPSDVPGEHWLELHGADENTLWFENRPGSQTGAMSNQEMLDQFFAGSDADEVAEPPNAAVDAWDPATNSDIVVGLKLLDGKWDPATKTLRYRVTELVETGAPAAGPSRIGGSLPAAFDEVGLFIDDGIRSPGNAKGKLIADIYTLVATFVGYITDRHTCSAVLENVTDDTLKWVTDDSKGTDTWRQNPTRDFEWAAYWTTSAGFMRGCWNWVLYKGPRGTVAVGTSNPWSGSNNSTCETTGVYKCVYQMTGKGSSRGNTYIVTYCVYEDREGEMYCLAD